LVPDVRAKFHQNRLKIATVRGRARTHTSALDIGHRTPDIGHRTANDFIFCPMLLYIALDRQQ